MAAAAFFAQLAVRYASGRPFATKVSMSDVADAFATFTDGATDFVFPEDVAIEDYSVNTGGTDTTNVEVWINGSNSGMVWNNKSNLDTLQNRTIARQRYKFRRGTKIAFKQKA